MERNRYLQVVVGSYSVRGESKQRGSCSAFRICFSGDSSATSGLSFVFSLYCSFNRLAWSSFSPPDSFRQR
jgi:hypothetical protein